MEAFENDRVHGLKLVATDMGPAYISAVRANIPEYCNASVRSFLYY
ncbi:MAG: hypothetical protein IPH22_13875 [Nitrosomonas sp.]|nr:hypothetical protein [Nitrosomonas sp.]